MGIFRNIRKGVESKQKAKVEQEKIRANADVEKQKIDLAKQKDISIQKGIDANLESKRIDSDKESSGTTTKYVAIGFVVLIVVIGIIIYVVKKKK